MTARDFSQEIDFWKKEIHSNLKIYEDRNSGAAESPELLLKLTFKLLSKRNKLAILDLGCGPLSLLIPKDFPNQELYFFDPLNDIYEKILFSNEIIRKGHYRKVSAEELGRYEFQKKFNLIFARNSLDHSEDLITGIKSILRSLKNNGVVLIEIFENEGEHAGYIGLHKWNIMKLGDDLILWYPGRYVSLSKLLNKNKYFLNCHEFLSFNAELQKEVKLLEVLIVKSSINNCYKSENEHVKILYSPLEAVKIKIKSNRYKLPYFAHLYFEDQTIEEKSFQRFDNKGWRNFMYNFREKKLTKLIVGQFNTDFDSQGKEVYSNIWELQLDVN